MLAFHKQKGAEGTILVTRVRYSFIAINAYLLCSLSAVLHAAEGQHISSK